MAREITITLGEGALKQFQELRDATGASTNTEVVVQALRVYHWLIEKIDDGHELGLTKDGQVSVYARESFIGPDFRAKLGKVDRPRID